MSKELCFPPKVLEQHLVVLGKTGSGKSSSLRHVVEYLLRHKKRVCIIDPKGDWWGLKSSADGKSAGFPVIAFGNFKEPSVTDIPLNPQSGKHVAELITSGNRPCIIGFRGWMPGEIAEFWIGNEQNRWNGFASTLFNTNAGEIYVVVDEVHNFAPKGKVLDPKAGRVLHWTNRLLNEGRGLGMVFLIASQRPQKVHNDTLTACDTLVAMRVIHKADRDAVKAWIDGCGDGTHGTEILQSIGGMPRGEAWVWSAEIGFGPERIKFPMFETFDSFAPPQLQKKVSQSGWSAVDLDAVKSKLAAVIEESKANDPAELKKQIMELKRQMAQKPAQAKPVQVLDEKKMQAAVNAAVKTAVAKEREEMLKHVDLYRGSLNKLLVSASTSIVEATRIKFAAPALKIENIPVHIDSSVPKTEVRLQTPAQAVRVTNVALPITNNGLPNDILRVLAEFEAIGRKQINRHTLAACCGKSVGGYFNNTVGGMKTQGLVDYPSGGTIALTDAGREKAPAVEISLTNADVLANALTTKVASGLGGRILKELHAAYPESLSREDLSESVGARGGYYNNTVGALKTAEFVSYPAKGSVKCADWFFID